MKSIICAGGLNYTGAQGEFFAAATCAGETQITGFSALMPGDMELKNIKIKQLLRSGAVPRKGAALFQ